MDDLSSKLKKAEKDSKDFQKAMVGAFKDAGSAIAGFALQTGKSLASLALGDIGFASQAKKVLAFRDSIAQLTITADKGADYMKGLREEIHGVAKASNQMQDDVTEALNAFVAKTGDIDKARANLEMYGKVATATGASIKDVALVGVELDQKMGITSAADQKRALAILTQQGKAGAIEIKDLATKAPKIFSAANAYFGVKGVEGMASTGALTQVAVRAFGGTGTAASVATSIDNIFGEMVKNKKRIDKIVGHNTQGLDPYSVIKDLIEKTGGDPAKLMKDGKHGVFNKQALRGINALSAAYRKDGDFREFDKFLFKGDFGNIEKDFALRTSTGQSKLTAAQISVAESADKNLGDSFDKLADNAHHLSDAFSFATRNLGLTAAVAGVGVVGSKLGGAALSVAVARGMNAAPSAAASLPGIPGAASMFANIAAPIFAGLAGVAIGTILDQTFGISDKASKLLVDNKNDQMNKAADERLGVRGRGVRYFETLGQSHGKAMKSQMDIEGLEHIFERLTKQVNQINVKIVNDRVESVESNGTRSEASVIRRGMAPGERAHL